MPPDPFGPPPAYGTPGSYQAGPGQPGGPPLATWGQRALGFLVDAGILFVAQALVGTVSQRLASLVGLAGWLYYCYLESQDGRSIGKRVMGTRLLREDNGQTVGFGTAVGRRLLHILDALPVGIGYLWPLWDPKRQTFADKIVKTVVIKG